MNVWLLTFLEDRDMQSVHMTLEGICEYIHDVLDDMFNEGDEQVTIRAAEQREDYVRYETQLGDFVAELKPVGK